MICEHNDECTKDAVAIVSEIAQDQSILSQTPVCDECLTAWTLAEERRFSDDEFLISPLPEL